MDLHIAQRLRKLLPPLTAEEKKQLKENIESDGEVLEPILYWNDGKRNVIVDGMNRWDIVKGGEFDYSASEMEFASYEEVEIWILNHQLGRRNLLKPAAIRKLRGELYNRLKRKDGGHGDQKSGRQNDGPIGDAATEVAGITGVSARTVERDGARVAAESKLTKAAKVIAEKASDSDVKALAKLDSARQNEVARAVRTGQAASVKEAIEHSGSKPAKSRPSKGKETMSAAKLVDILTKKHVGQIARGLTAIAKANGGEGAQFKKADDGLNQMIRAMQEMRKGKR